MPPIIIIVPCFNEALRLQMTPFLTFVAKYPEVELCFINDGSTDNTGDVIKQLESQSNSITTINLSKNKGKGEAIRQGILNALPTNVNYIGYLDADLSTSLEEFYDLYKIMLTHNAKIALASRIKKADTNIERSLTRHLVGRTIATIIDKKLKLGCYDTQCGAKIFSAETLKQTTNEPFLTRWFFDIELFMRIKKITGQLNAVEVPLTSWHHVKNSKLNLFSFPVILKEIYIILSKY